MKKYGIILIALISILSLSACGSYKANLSELGTMYVSKEYHNQDNSYPSITIKSVERKNNEIIISTESPVEQMDYALKNFLAFQAISESGDTSDQINVKLEEKNQQGVFILTGDGIKDSKYIQIMPYKNKDSFLEFEIH